MGDHFTLQARRWQVLLLGGPSGAGKSAVSYRLARHFGVGLTEVDDFHVMLERLTTPAQQPALHFWATHPAPHTLTATEIFEQGLTIGQALAPGLEAVIANHLEAQTPLVLEGDFLHPALAAQTAYVGEANAGRVRGVFLYEPDERQLVENFSRREPTLGPQTKRAQVSVLYGQWLQREAERHGVPAVPARPWETLLQRVIDAAA
jgi:2-phosphoglycerate kinase